MRARIVFGVLVLFAVAVVLILLQRPQQNRQGYMTAARLAYTTNLYLATMLPAMQNPREGMRTLGLPEHCAPYIGRGFYEPGMFPSPCPEVMVVPRTRILQTLLKEPPLFFRLTSEALKQTRPWIVDYLGQIEGEHYGKLDTALPSATWSMDALVNAIPPPIYFLLIALALISGGVSTVLVLYSWFRPISKELIRLSAFQLYMLGLAVAAFYSSLFGEGYINFAKHFYIGQIPLALAVAGSVTLCALWLMPLIRRIRSRPMLAPQMDAAAAPLPDA